jgi:GNAT superfamily N-acetyltransferase
MIVRVAKTEDIPAIVALLKDSLGESLLKKTTSIWDFKHVQNPFGASYVLVAEENGQFIGVRAFMSWKWQLGDKVWQAYRAVDTATHPEHQGKGIFKKLTLQALADVGKKNDCFIFNTPNEKSRPGYLKMGWEALGKIKIALVPVLLYRFIYLFSKRADALLSLNEEQIEAICFKHNLELQAKKELFTPKTEAYLHWRYATNPMQPYTFLTGKDWYLAMYVKKHKRFNELRIAEVIGGNTSKAKKEIQQEVVNYATKQGCLLLSTTEKSLFSFAFYGAFGPILTCKDLTLNNVILQQSKQSRGWHYAMGDLELF